MRFELREREKRILEKIRNKKIICYGVLASYITMNQILDLDDSVEFLVDRDCSKWGQYYYGKEVKSPDEISKLDKGSYIIIVFVRTFEPVYHFLDNIGLKHKVQYIHISELLGLRYELVRFANTANMLLHFLDTVPKEMKDVVPKKEHGKIGIVTSIEAFGIAVDFPYSIALFLILKWKGYHVQLIMDNLRWTADTDLYEGCHEDLQHISDQIAKKLKEIVSPTDILYLDGYGNRTLTKDDEQECEKIAKYSAQWQKWHGCLEHIRVTPLERLEVQFAEAFKRNMGYVEGFFEKNDYDTINASTGLHKRAGVISYVAKKKGIRVSSQDGDGWNSNLMLESSGPASHGNDIVRTIKENWVHGKKEVEILKRASKIAEKRFMLVDIGHKISNLEQYQREVRLKGHQNVTLQSAQKEMTQKYDVVIPLNMPYDAAALGLETIFNNKENWLIETLDFVINILEKSVLLREHPALRILLSESYSRSDLASQKPHILDPYKTNPLLYYANFDEDINLYQYIEQCKVVLPWSSTVGMEAAIMQKNVIVHTDTFYGDSTFVLKARSREEYFSFIRQCIEQDKWLVPDKKTAHQDALKYFYFGMNRLLNTKLTLYGTDLECQEHQWMGMSFEALLNERGVEEIVQIVAENIPSVYLTAQQ